MEIIDGRKLRDEILDDIKKKVAALESQPVFCDVLVGEDPASMQYVRMKAKTAESVGIKFHQADFPEKITTEELIKEIEKLNKVPHMCGIIVQLPLPEHLDRQKVLDAIDPNLDVDSLGTESSREFYEGKIEKGFPTALACMALLDSTRINLKDKKIAVIGYGALVGRPVCALLSFRGYAPYIVRSKTENKDVIIKEADIIISATGKGKLITGDKIKEGVILIDAGTSESGGGIVGDIDLESVKEKASFVSPVPGGVGPVTVAMLLKNVLKTAETINQ